MVSLSIDSVPLPLLVVGLVVAFVAAVFGGYHLGVRFPDNEREPSELSGVAVASAVTLVGFLIAFAFSVAESNFDERRQLVIVEGNAISETFANAEFLQEPHRSTIQDALIDYVELRARFDEFEGSNSRLDEFVRQSEDLHEVMRSEGAAAVTLDPSPITATYVTALTGLVDVHNLRTDVRWNRIPGPVFVTLFLLSVAAMILLGFSGGRSSRTALPSAIFLIFTYAVIFTIVIDLDRHTSGIFSVNQQPVIEVRDNLVDG